MWEAEQRGKEAGREEGEHDRNIQIAKNLLSLNVPINIITQGTGLTIKQMEALKK